MSNEQPKNRATTQKSENTLENTNAQDTPLEQDPLEKLFDV
jgi:hypothetical protein